MELFHVHKRDYVHNCFSSFANSYRNNIVSHIGRSGCSSKKKVSLSLYDTPLKWEENLVLFFLQIVVVTEGKGSKSPWLEWGEASVRLTDPNSELL